MTENSKLIYSKEEAITRMQTAYTGVVLSVIRQILKDERLVEECLNDVWYKISENLGKLGDLGDCKTKGYICATAKTTAIDIYRREKHEMPVGMGDEVMRYAERAVSFVQNEAENDRQSEILSELLAALKPIDRRIIILHFCHKFTYREIAAELGMSAAAARKRGERAERLLKDKTGGGNRK